jgi:hypothetical protein
MVAWYNAMMMDGYLKLLRELKITVTYEQKLCKHCGKIWKCRKPKRNCAHFKNSLSSLLHVLITELGGMLEP